MRFAAALVLAGTFAFAQSTMFPPVRGVRDMVAAANNFEVEAGYRILQQGGNAVDSGVATVLAAAVTEQARFGLGGEIPILIKMAGKPVVVISGIGTAPALATVDAYRNRQLEPWENPGRAGPIPSAGLKAAVLPGAISGLLLALEQYGTKSFADVAAPAIEYADGFPIGEEFVSFIRREQQTMQHWPASRDFFMPSGAVPEVGKIFREPTLAATLRELVGVEKRARGNRARKLRAVHDYVYRGRLAERIARFSEENGGFIRLDDLRKFRAETDTPRCIPFREYEVCKPGFWTQGPVLLQTLAILDGYDLRAMQHNSAEYLHTVVEAVKLAFADRDAHYGDPKFSSLPERELLSSEYAAQRRTLIDPQRASLEHRPGAPQGGSPALTGSGVKTDTAVQDTTSVAVVDKSRNFFSATPSGAWIPSVIAGDTGIPFSTRLESFVLDDGHPNQLGAGKRPRVTLSPTLILKDGEAVMAITTPGGDNQDQATLQVLLNLVEFGMKPQDAVEAARFQTSHFYASFAGHSFEPGKLALEGRIAAPVAERLRELGHVVTVARDWSNSSAPVVIQLKDGVLHGGADPRRGRFVFGR
jgi:gamma-glutamyltranspeptidase/glutathione hydrolase